VWCNVTSTAYLCRLHQEWKEVQEEVKEETEDKENVQEDTFSKKQRGTKRSFPMMGEQDEEHCSLENRREQERTGGEVLWSKIDKGEMTHT